MTGDIEWIKLSTAIFKDTKMELIQSMPDGESIMLTWIRLLCLAGQTNDNGAMYITPGINYSEETLATILHRPVNSIRLALETFRRLGIVISRDDGVMCITNWIKYQNVKGMDDIREANRIRNFEYRKRQKTLKITQNDSHVTSRVISRDAPEIEIEIERDKEKIPILDIKESLVASDGKNRPKPVKISFSFEEAKWVNLSEEDGKRWGEAYPACDVRQELCRMREWLLANPSKRKSNYRLFITKWLTRAQDNGGTKNTGRPAGKGKKCPRCGVIHQAPGELCLFCMSHPEETPRAVV